MQQTSNNKHYDLESRTRVFAKNCRSFLKLLPRTISNYEDIKQLTRSSGSIAANYIEANEALSKKDFLMRVKICKKESKETCLWLTLVDVKNDPILEKERLFLFDEATQIMKIFGSIVEKSKTV